MKAIILVLLSFIGFLILGFLILGLIDSLYDIKCRFFCDYFGWHKEPKDTTFNGFNSSGKCPRCGKEVMQDSQGNWF